MKILVINAGSSSIKCQYFSGKKSVASLLIERIGEEVSYAELKSNNVTRQEETPLANHHEALEKVFSLLTENHIIDNIDRLDAVGHRVVHGGTKFSEATLITDAVIEEIRSLIPLAPLHNPANLEGIEVLHHNYPNLKQTAVFDTAFHQSMPASSYRYALPYDLSDKLHIRRYGFHGTSHAYVAKEAAKILNKSPDEVNLITLHLGNGASATAIASGKSVDTSMGMTPLEGLMMGTRSGDIDPAIIPYLENNSDLNIDDIDTMLNKKSGLKGICGTNDMREVLQKASEGDERSKLALEMYVYRIKKYIGAYTVALGKVDAIVFTGGIGEHASEVRMKVCEGLDISIGLKIDQKKNEHLETGEQIIHAAESSIPIFVIATNEELEIAQQTAMLIG